MWPKKLKIHSILTMHSSLVTRMRGFETKLKFLYKNVFQEIDDHFHAKKFKAILIHGKLQA